MPRIDFHVEFRHVMRMVALSQINVFAREIAKRFNPEKIILFGSYAHGHPTEDSDVDLLVIMDHQGKSSQQALTIRRAIRKTFPLDLIVRTPRETKNRLKQNDAFITSALTTGRTLYERTK